MRYLIDESEIGTKMAQAQKRLDRSTKPQSRLYWQGCLNTLKALFCEPDAAYMSDSFTCQLERGMVNCSDWRES